MGKFQQIKNENLKEECLRFLGGKICSKCRTNFLPICCYDFHHSKGVKEEEISKMISRKKKLDEELKKELDKCKVVCGNCHRIITKFGDSLQLNSEDCLKLNESVG